MRTNLIKKHFINNQGTLDTFVKGIGDTETTLEIAKSKGYDLALGVKVTVDEKKLRETSPEIIEQARDAVRKLPADVFLIYDPENRGSGVSVRQIFFNHTFVQPPGLVVNADYDQNILDTQASLERAIDFCHRTEREGSLLGIASRDVPVTLATHERNSDLRIIHELFHSLTIGSCKLRAGTPPGAVTPAYREIGESTTGFSVLNLAHPQYPALSYAMATACQQTDMSGFATDYFLSITASLLGTITTGYTNAKENAFYVKRDQDEEFRGVTSMIARQTAALAKTDIAGTLRATLDNPRAAERIKEFYAAEDVELVRKLMRESF